MKSIMYCNYWKIAWQKLQRYWYLHDSLQAFYSISVICGAHIVVREVRAPQLPARNSLVRRAWQLGKCAHLNLGRVWQLGKCAHLNLERVWRLAKCAYFNLRHAIPFLSFVVRTLQFVKCAHLNPRRAIHWWGAPDTHCAQPQACAQPDSQLTHVACMKEMM